MYVFYNPNPLGLLTGDCVIRALTKALDETWDSVYISLSLHGHKMCDWGSNNAVWDDYLRSVGFARMVIPDTCPDCYTVERFAKEHPDGKYILSTGSHVVVVENGDYYDTWDSGQEIPMYYYQRRDENAAV